MTWLYCHPNWTQFRLTYYKVLASQLHHEHADASQLHHDNNTVLQQHAPNDNAHQQQQHHLADAQPEQSHTSSSDIDVVGSPKAKPPPIRIPFITSPCHSPTDAIQSDPAVGRPTVGEDRQEKSQEDMVTSTPAYQQ